MKSFAELEALREKMKSNIGIRSDDSSNIKISVGMATCGISAGARDTVAQLSESIEKNGLTNVALIQTGCIGLCMYEPIVTVEIPGQEKTVYVKVNRQKADRIITEHIVGGKVVEEYTIGAIAG